MRLAKIENIIRDAFSNDDYFNSVYFGDAFYFWNTEKNVRYGSITFGLQSVQVGDNETVYTYLVTAADRLNEAQYNYSTIYQNCIEHIELELANIEDEVNRIDTDRIYRPFNQKFMDVLAGVQLTVSIITPNAEDCEE